MTEEFQALIAKACAMWDAMSPEEQEAMSRKQAKSWDEAEMKMGETTVKTCPSDSDKVQVMKDANWKLSVDFYREHYEKVKKELTAMRDVAEHNFKATQDARAGAGALIEQAVKICDSIANELEEDFAPHEADCAIACRDAIKKLKPEDAIAALAEVRKAERERVAALIDKQANAARVVGWAAEEIKYKKLAETIRAMEDEK